MFCHSNISPHSRAEKTKLEMSSIIHTLFERSANIFWYHSKMLSKATEQIYKKTSIKLSCVMSVSYNFAVIQVRGGEKLFI